jgi:cytochrome c oxidase subunit 2
VAVVEAILLIGFSIPLWAERVAGFPAPQDATRVRVVGQQFAWNIHYPGPDGVFGKTDVTLVDEQANPLGLDRSDPAAKDDVTTINQLHCRSAARCWSSSAART